MLTRGLQRRLRIMCHLPNRERGEIKAFDAVIEFLESPDCPLKVLGYTQSHNLEGIWWSLLLADWIRDRISVITVDLPPSSDDAFLQEVATDLKNYAHECYEYYDVPQEEIWVISHDVIRYL